MEVAYPGRVRPAGSRLLVLALVGSAAAARAEPAPANRVTAPAGGATAATSAGAMAGASATAQVASGARAVTRLEADTARLAAERAALERDSRALAADIERLKAAPPGVRRDGALEERLAAQKAKSDALDRVATELRGALSLLGGARRKLIDDCDRALAGRLGDAERLELARLRTAQAAALTTPDDARPLDVARVAVDPLDGPRALAEKADLLRDSEDKLRREVARLASRIDDVERRRHLRERADAVDDDLFGESFSNRRTVRAGVTSNDRGQTGFNGAGAPAPGGGGGGPGGGGGGPGGGAGGGPGGGVPAPGSGVTSPIVFNEGAVLRNLVDPSTLEELRRSDGGDDLERQLRALRRAQGELAGLADALGRRARALSERAAALRRQK